MYCCVNNLTVAIFGILTDSHRAKLCAAMSQVPFLFEVGSQKKKKKKGICENNPLCL